MLDQGLITEEDVNKAIEYQKIHTGRRLGDIIKILNLCDEYQLIDAIGEILNERAILLHKSDVAINVTDYISLDVAKPIL